MRSGSPSALVRRAGVALCLPMCLAFAAGCAGHSKKTLEARNALDANHPREAQALFNDLLEVDSAAQQPGDLSGDRALFLLDRAMVSQELREYADSAQDFQNADKQVEMLDFKRSKGAEIGKYLFSDDVGAYRARPYEKLFINTLNMVNFLAQGDLEGARIEARRFATMQRYLESEGEGEDDDAEVEASDAQSRDAMLSVGSYLAGFTYEKTGNADEALRYYDEALSGQAFPSLSAPVQRLAQYSSVRSPRITPLVDAAEDTSDADDDTAELLIVLGYGRVPALYARRIPIGLAITYASAFMPLDKMQAARRMAGQGLVTWVNIPAMGPSPKQYASPSVQVDGQNVRGDEAMRVDELVRTAWDEGHGPVVAAALTRAITRAAVGQGVQKAGGGGGLGVFLSLVTQATLTAVDTPDTRSWVTLPARIGFVRLRLPAGQHSIRFEALGRVETVNVELKPGGWALANFTQLRMPYVPKPNEVGFSSP